MYFYKEQNQQIYIGDYENLFLIEKNDPNFMQLIKKYNWVQQDVFWKLGHDIGVAQIVSCGKDIITFIANADPDKKCNYYVIDFYDMSLLLNAENIGWLEYILYWYKKSQSLHLCGDIDFSRGMFIYQENNLRKILKLLLKSEEKNMITYYDKFEKRIFRNTMDLCNVARNFNQSRELELNFELIDWKSKIEIECGRFSPIVSIQRKKNSSNKLIKVCETITNGGNGVYFDTQSGKGFSRKRAFNSAVGEAMERFYSMKFEKDKLIYHSFNELKLVYKDVDIIYEGKGKGWKNEKREWVFAFNLKKKIPCIVEAERVFFPYMNSDTEHSTTGLGAGNSLEGAIENALLEVVERDAYSITFRANKKTKRIEWKDINNKNRYRINQLKKLGIKCHLVLLYSDIPVYIVHCMFDNISGKFPRYTHGSSARFELNAAIEGAICECAQLRISQIELERYNQIGLKENKAYCEWGKGNLDYCGIFLEENSSTNNIVKYENYVPNFLKLLEVIEDDVICVDLSVENCDFKIAKVIIPSFQDIDNGSLAVSQRLSDALGESEMNRRVLFT